MTPLSLPEIEVPEKKLCFVQTIAQVPFRVTRFFVAYHVARHFVIRDLVIGTQSQFLHPFDVPADLFSLEVKRDEVTFKGTPIKMDPVFPGANITLSVLNISSATRTFRSCLYGERVTKLPF